MQGLNDTVFYLSRIFIDFLTIRVGTLSLYQLFGGICLMLLAGKLYFIQRGD